MGMRGWRGPRGLADRQPRELGWARVADEKSNLLQRWFLLLSRMSSKCVFLSVSSRHEKQGIFTDLFLSIEDSSPLAHARDSLYALQSVKIANNIRFLPEISISLRKCNAPFIHGN